jgi:hypothetical protein
MIQCKRSVQIALMLLLLVAAPPPVEGTNPYLNQAKVFQQQLDWEKCLRRLEQASRWNANTSAQLAEIELYAGLCEAGLGHETEAYEHFELGFQLDPALELPPQLGPKISALFQKAKAKAAKSRPAAVEPELKKQPELAPAATPSLEPVAAPPPTPPPAVAAEAGSGAAHIAVPLAFGGISLISGGIGLVFGLQSKSTLDQARLAHFDSEDAALRRVAADRALVADVLFAVAGAALVAAVIAFFVTN